MSTLDALRALRAQLAGSPEHAAGVAALDHVLGVIREARVARDAFRDAMRAYCAADGFAFQSGSSSILSSAFCPPETRARIEPLKRAYDAAGERMRAADLALARLLADLGDEARRG